MHKQIVALDLPVRAARLPASTGLPSLSQSRSEVRQRLQLTVALADVDWRLKQAPRWAHCGRVASV